MRPHTPLAQAYSTQQPLVRASTRHAQVLAKLAGGSAHVSRLSSGMEVLYVLEERSTAAVSLITDVGVRLAAGTHRVGAGDAGGPGLMRS